MSNNIVAYVDGSDVSAVSYDGTSWEHKNNSPYIKWKVIAGAPGQYLYEAYDTRTPYSDVVYSTLNGGTTWTAGVLPNPTSNNIVAIAEGDQYFYTSFNGSTFNSSKPPAFTYEIVTTAKSYSTSTFAEYSSFIRIITLLAVVDSHAWLKFPATKFIYAITATANSIASIFTRGNNL